MSQGYDLANYLKQFDLTIEDLQNESGRSRATLYLWYKKDQLLLKCIIRSCLLSKHKDKKTELDAKLELAA